MPQLVELHFPGKEKSSPRGLWNHPVLALGFRPFFLVGAIASSLLILSWILVFTGHLALPSHMNIIAWHSHEMIFGFTASIIAGFLLTAVRNWTGHDTPSGLALGSIVLLWLAGRGVMLFVGSLPAFVPLVIDGAFFPVVTLAIARPIFRTNNKRNFGIVAMLAALSLTNILYHLKAWPMFRELHIDPIYVALGLVVLIMLVIGGRVIPFFTRNALQDSSIDRTILLDKIALGFTVLWLIAMALSNSALFLGITALLAGIANAARMKQWGTLKTSRVPLLWVLHLGYLWIVIGLILMGLHHLFAIVPLSASIHALTVGAIGLLTIGMMARVSLGHTGRPLRVGRWVTLSFVLVAIAALVRVFVPIVAPTLYLSSIAFSGILWSAAYILFAFVYWPILTTPRPDGRPG